MNPRNACSILALIMLLAGGAHSAAAENAAVIERVRAELARLLKKDAATLPVDRTVHELGGDDLTVVEWTMALDKAFDIDIPDERIDSGEAVVRRDLTISAMTKVVNEQLAGRKRGP